MILQGQTSALFLQIVKDMSVTGLETYHEMDAQYQEDYYGAESIHHLFGDEFDQILKNIFSYYDKKYYKIKFLSKNRTLVIQISINKFQIKKKYKRKIIL